MDLNGLRVSCTKWKLTIFIQRSIVALLSAVGTLRDVRNYVWTFLESLPFALFGFIQAKTSVSGFSSIYIWSVVFTSYKLRISIL